MNVQTGQLWNSNDVSTMAWGGEQSSDSSPQDVQPVLKHASCHPKKARTTPYLLGYLGKTKRLNPPSTNLT